MKSSDLIEKSNMFNIGILLSLTPVIVVLGYLLWQLKNESSKTGIIFNLLIFLVVFSSIILIFSIRLNLYINNDFIRIKYFPIKTINIHKSDIKMCTVNKVNAISEFGGWGVKKSKKYGQGYTTKGDLILTIEKNDNTIYSVSIFNKKLISTILTNYNYNCNID